MEKKEVETKEEIKVIEAEEGILDIILDSFISGVLIAISAYMYSVIENKYVASVLFSLGLISILLFELDLCTGKFCFRKQGFLYLTTIFIFNLCGTGFVALMIKLSGKDLTNITNILSNKMNKSIPELLIDSILCGIFIGIAVIGFKESMSLIIPIIAVSCFLLIGSEHVVANSFYLFINFDDSTVLNESVKFLSINLLGNILGGKIMSYIV